MSNGNSCKSKNKCTPCEANFEKNIDNIVDQAKQPSQEEHAKRDKEVKQAFDTEKQGH